MTEKKVLIITYYWPPSGGSGVQRWLKFVKYLPHFGYTPYVFTPENPSFDIKDESLLKDVPKEAEVIHFPIWEPYKLFFGISNLFGHRKQDTKTTNLVSTEKKSLFQRISTWMRGNLIIPDPRVFWVRPSVKVLEDIIKDNDINIIVTTGPPHSVHLIGLGLKKKIKTLKWIADFRDPWSEWGLLDSLNVGTVARAMHRRLEKKVLRSADTIITITPFYVRKFSALSGRQAELITNGFDEDDFSNLKILRPDVFVVRHIGIVNEKCDPRPFMKTMKELMETDPEFAALTKIEFIGDIHPGFKEFVYSDAVLNKVTTLIPPVPHKSLIDLYGTSALLLLILTGYKDAEGYMPGKLFEYIATGLPVLGVGPINGDAAELLKEAGTGLMIDTPDSEAIKNYVRSAFVNWKTGGNSTKGAVSTSRLSRRAITARLVQVFEAQHL